MLVLSRSLHGFTPEAEKDLSHCPFCKLQPCRKTGIWISGVARESPELSSDIWACKCLGGETPRLWIRLGQSPSECKDAGALRMLARGCWQSFVLGQRFMWIGSLLHQSCQHQWVVCLFFTYFLKCLFLIFFSCRSNVAEGSLYFGICCSNQCSAVYSRGTILIHEALHFSMRSSGSNFAELSLFTLQSISEALFYNAILSTYYIFCFSMSTLNIQWAPKCINKKVQINKKENKI